MKEMRYCSQASPDPRREGRLFKVNRGEPDFRQRHSLMSTSNAGRMKEGCYRGKERRWGLRGCWNGNGSYWETVYWPKPWSLSLCDLGDICLLLLGNTVTAGSKPSRLWGRAWEKGCREAQTCDIPDAQYLSVSKNTCKTIQFHISQVPINPTYCTKLLHLFWGRVPTRNQYESRFTSGRRRPFKTFTINCCQSEEIFHCLKAL